MRSSRVVIIEPLINELRLNSTNSNDIFICSECNETFPCQNLAIKHRESVHQLYHKVQAYESHLRRLAAAANQRLSRAHLRAIEYRFKCVECSTEYQSRKLLRQHYQRQHETEQYQCTQCDCRYALLRDLKHHIQRKHHSVKSTASNCNEIATPTTSLQQIKNLQSSTDTQLKPIARRPYPPVNHLTQTDLQHSFSTTQSTSISASTQIKTIVDDDTTLYLNVGTQHQAQEINASVQTSSDMAQLMFPEADISYANAGTSTEQYNADDWSELLQSSVAIDAQPDFFALMADHSSTQTEQADQFIDNLIQQRRGQDQCTSTHNDMLDSPTQTFSFL